MDEAARMAAYDHGDERREAGNRFLAFEPAGLDAIENRHALPEHGQHRRTAGRVEAGGEGPLDVFTCPRVELRLQTMKSREKPGNGRPAPCLQSQKPRGR